MVGYTEVVAEISGCHGGDLQHARTLIRTAKQHGADAVKFQCFEPKLLAEKRGRDPALYVRTHTPKEWFEVLITECEQNKIPWFSSVFDARDVTFLDKLGCPRYKIASFELEDEDLFASVMMRKKPIIFSVGGHNVMSRRLSEVLTSLFIEKIDTTVLYATEYAVRARHAHLSHIETLRVKTYDASYKFGLSDHTIEIGAFRYIAAIIATTMRVNMIERHLRLEGVRTPDDEFALTGPQFHDMILAIRHTQMAMDL